MVEVGQTVYLKPVDLKARYGKGADEQMANELNSKLGKVFDCTKNNLSLDQLERINAIVEEETRG